MGERRQGYSQKRGPMAPHERIFLRRRKFGLVGRNFKRRSERDLTVKDLQILEFLWNWKAASTPMLKEVAFKDESHWWVYRALRRLKQERYIQLLPRGRNLDLELWALTRNGFEVVLMDRDDIEQYRYRVHAPAHDYLATCLQLGDLWQSKINTRFITEQQLSSLSSWNFPKLRDIEGHIPDGISIVSGTLHTVTIGYEVDINLKEEERYWRTAEYYNEGVQPNLVVWLVRNKWMAGKIFECMFRHGSESHETIQRRYAFFLLDDFKENIWDAKAISPAHAGVSIHKLHASLIQTAGNTQTKLAQKSMREIFFPKFKSPQKLKGYLISAQAQSPLTPYGSRGDANLSLLTADAYENAKEQSHA